MFLLRSYKLFKLFLALNISKNVKLLLYFIIFQLDSQTYKEILNRKAHAFK